MTVEQNRDDHQYETPSQGAWRPVDRDTPRNKRLLLFGTMRPYDGLRVIGPEVFSGYWDEIDQGWCGNGSTWEGPFYDVTHWMPLPAPPHSARVTDDPLTGTAST
jgi:hypothetical protein